MARRSQHSFLKRQKEIKRKETAAEKMARRQGKIERPRNADEDEQELISPSEQEESSSEEQSQENP